MTNELLVYSLKSGMVLALLYLPYVLMLRRERFFRLNRMALLGMVLVSAVLPLCRVSYSVDADEPVTTIVETQDLAFRTEAMIVEASPWDVWQWLTSFYLIGVAVALGYRAYQLLLVRRVIVRGSLWRQREADGTTIYCHAGDGPSFSWMHSIVISQQDYEQNSREVLLHEQAHICCGHSFDILLLTAVKVLQWWNPVAYLLDKSLRDVHEYEADDYVLQQGVSLSAYQALLARKAVQGASLAFANNFNRSSVMKRIDMMRRPPSSPWMRGKLLYVVPILAVTLMVSARPVFEPLILLDGEEISGDHLKQFPKDSIDHVEVLKGKSATTFYGAKGRGGAIVVTTKKTSPASTKDDNLSAMDIEAPHFIGGNDAANKYIREHLEYPEEAVEHNIQARVDMTAIVEVDGNLTNVHAAIGKLNEDYPKEYYPYIRQILKAAEDMAKSMPQWEPARQHGKAVRAKVTFPLFYRLD